MRIYLLTHQRELKKPTNTGRIVKACRDDGVEIVTWRRTEPCEEILQLIERDKIALLYPADDDSTVESCLGFNNFLILDATWQEARKMYNRSPYLQRASRVSFKIAGPSRYRLRRNQIANGLSTAECAIELLKLKGQERQAACVELAFAQFNAK